MAEAKMLALQPAVLDQFRPVWSNWADRMQWTWEQFIRYVTALAHIESRANPRAFNTKYGAYGLWQFIPKTWAHYSTVPQQQADAVEQARAYAAFTNDNLRAISLYTPEYWTAYNSAHEPDTLALTLATLHHAGVANWKNNRIGPNTVKFQEMLKPLLWQSSGPGQAFGRSFAPIPAAPAPRAGVLDNLLNASKSYLSGVGLLAAAGIALLFLSQQGKK